MNSIQAEPTQPLGKGLVHLMIGQGISMIGDQFTDLALMWFIVSDTGSALQVGINLSLIFIPSLILSPFVGNIVDRSSRKKLLWGSDILRCILDIIIIVVIVKGLFSIYLIYSYTALKAIFRLFYTPAQRAVIQQLTNTEQRVQANALQQLSQNGAFVIGPICAGLAVKYLPLPGVIAIDAATFIISALIILSISINEEHLLTNQAKSYWQQMHEGLAYVAIHRWIVFLSLAYAFVNGGNALANVSKPFLINTELNLGADAYGMLNSFGAVGALAMAAVLMKKKLKGHKLSYVVGSIAIWGLGMMLLSLTTSFFMVILIQLIAFSMGPVMATSSSAFYQDEIPSEYMGRVQSVRTFISTLAMPVGYLFGAKLIELTSIRGSFIFAGFMVLIGSIFALLAKTTAEKGKLNSS